MTAMVPYIGLQGLQDFEKLNWQTAYWESGQSKFQKNAHQLFLAKKETRKLYLRPHRMHRTDAAYCYRCRTFSCFFVRLLYEPWCTLAPPGDSDKSIRVWRLYTRQALTSKLLNRPTCFSYKYRMLLCQQI